MKPQHLGGSAASGEGADPADLAAGTRQMSFGEHSPLPNLPFDELLDSAADYAGELAERVSMFMDRRGPFGFLEQATRLDYGSGLISDWISQAEREHRYSTPECRSTKIAATQVRWFLEDALKAAEANDPKRMGESLDGLRESLQTLLGDLGRLINTMRQDATAVRDGVFNAAHPQASRQAGPFETLYQPLL
jgi:hypothetical protein